MNLKLTQLHTSHVTNPKPWKDVTATQNQAVVDVGTFEDELHSSFQLNFQSTTLTSWVLKFKNSETNSSLN